MGRALEAIGELSAILARRGDGQRAAELAALVQKQPASSWEARQHADKLLEQLGEALPGEHLTAAIHRGRVRPLEAAVAELLQNGNPRIAISSPL
jgi:hypothetical protein